MVHELVRYMKSVNMHGEKIKVSTSITYYINFLGGSKKKQSQVNILSAATCVLRGELDNVMYSRPRI